MIRLPPRSTLFPSTTLFRSLLDQIAERHHQKVLRHFRRLGLRGALRGAISHVGERHDDYVAFRFEFSLVLGHLLPSFQSELPENRVERAACDLLRWVTRHHRRACAETNHSVLLALFECTS